MARYRLLAHAAAVVTVTAALLTGVFISPAGACTCMPANEALRYQQATYVFSGVVVHEKVEESVYRYTVDVDTEYKGDVPHRVYVLTQRNNSCGIRLTVNAAYVVFAKGDVADRRVETDYCSGTRSAAAGPPTTTSPWSGTSTPPTTPCATPAP
ncbi:hypothetical protein ACFXGA_19605 [Actinosynnema sp. NPDC059335]|uniref:hypothetical protein n=1 Tax=Actinosynnema sp. NPDC059335 TaxID=3346804 RepID=UPI00366ED0EB